MVDGVFVNYEKEKKYEKHQKNGRNWTKLPVAYSSSKEIMNTKIETCNQICK